MLKQEIEELLNSSLLLTEIYFKIQELINKKYGKNAFVFIEIGSFFEIYEVNNEKEKIGLAKEIAELLNIQLTRKNKNILSNDRKNPLMAGVPSVSFDKYISKIISENKYTIAIIRQKGNPPKISRYLDTIISAGVNFDYISSYEENYLSSIVIDSIKGNFLVGYSCVDITTGKCFYNELYGSSEDKTFALDEIFYYMQIYKTKEVILTLKDKDNLEYIINYLELKNYHINENNLKIIYQNELFKRVFNIKSLLSPIEYLNLELLPLASESLAILIEFIISHDNTLVEKLSIPSIIDIKKYVYLGNNALNQLNILPEVLKIISNTSTAMGKRLLKERLTNPIKDKKEINNRYKLSEMLKDNFSQIEQELNSIYDIERLNRRLKLQKIHPFEIVYLFDSLINIKYIANFIKENNILKLEFEILEIENFIQDIKNNFIIENCSKYNLKDISENIIKENISNDIDILLNENNRLYNKLLIIKDKIASFLDDNNFVQISLNKDGFFITLTKTRFNQIKDNLLSDFVIIDNNHYYFKDFTIKTLTNSIKITSKIINQISSEYNYNISKIIELNKEIFLETILIFEKKYSNLLEKLTTFISIIDVAISNIKTAKKYNYSKPEIVDGNFIEIKDLRHPIIELNQENGIFIPNDIFLGDINRAKYKTLITKNIKNRLNGILLYGINSSGKSSLMKSIGICVILAQAGFYIPATKMRFSIFDSIFTRISGADNINRGLSSFAVEMMELKNIFNRANNKSLILGDEISHSTETISGVSIVSSAILKLLKKDSLFIFATHLHQLVEIDEIKNNKFILPLHLSINYDKEKDKLIFNRKLSLGSGSSIYGLEFAKALHMDIEFLNKAFEIRKRLTNDYHELELLKNKNKSKYNKNLFITKCAICGDIVDDIHHIKEQKNAKDNFIGHINKNHKYNLLPLCKLHHKLVHNGKIIINGFITTSNGIELHYDIKDA